jgi:hypothetical protein
MADPSDKSPVLPPALWVIDYFRWRHNDAKKELIAPKVPTSWQLAVVAMP